MKNLIFISGTMGAGKTAVGTRLTRLLDRCAFLDGDRCWDMHPFTLTDETKAMVEDNIVHLLNNFLSCSAFDTVIFVWVMHKQSIADGILNRIVLTNVRFLHYTLMCSTETLKQRLQNDVDRGIRTPDVIARSVSRQPLHETVNSQKVNTDCLTADNTAAFLAADILMNCLTDPNAVVACRACENLCVLSAQSNTVTRYTDTFFTLLTHKNSLVRNRAISLLAANAKWDCFGTIDRRIDELLTHVTDEKPITARQCIKVLPAIVAARPKLKEAIVSALENAVVSQYTDSMRPLIEKDISSALSAIFR